MHDHDCEGPIASLRHKVLVFKAVANAGVPASRSVFDDVWQWFDAVELVTPLPVLEMSDEERSRVSASILEDMVEVLERIEERVAKNDHRDHWIALSEGVDAGSLERLWREVAGAHAHFVNETCQPVDADDYVDERDNVVEFLMEEWELEDMDQVREGLRADTTMRMFVRRCGLDPDRVVQDI